MWATAVLLWLYYLTPLVALSARATAPSMIALSIAPPLAAFGLLALRGRAPLAAALGIAALLILSPGVIGAAFGAQASVARHRRALAAVGTGAVFLGAKLTGLLVGPFAAPWDTADTVEVAIAAVGVVFATLVGWLVRTVAAERRGAAETERARLAADAARLEGARLAERAAIAREMHDVLAHRLSLVSMHAGALAFRTDLGADEARETARTIQRNAKQSLDELRVVLSSLRGADAPPAPPQPTLAQLPVLIAELEDEQRIELRLDADLAAVPARLGRHAYRIVQEALTNARRHAPGVPVTLAVTGAPGGELAITVTNRLADLATPDRSGSGFGLLGLGERAAAMGGSVRHGPVDGRFVVEAVLPWREER